MLASLQGIYLYREFSYNGVLIVIIILLLLLLLLLLLYTLLRSSFILQTQAEYHG
jgi:hypothetical protein